jgi:L-asparagine transporter-like permease
MKERLQHKLENRHIQMIALGGIIGTGFFIGSASAINNTGLSLLLAYCLGGLLMYGIMRILGEMTVYAPNSGSFVDYAYRYLGQKWGFITGWNSWILFSTSCMLESTGASYLLDYWIIIPHWISCTVILASAALFNLLTIKLFGEMEFWFAGIKVVFIQLIIIAGIYLMFFDHNIHYTMINNLQLYKQPSIIFTHGVSGFMQTLSIICFAFSGGEFISVAAGEAANAKTDIPKAINGVVFKIVVFYIATISIILLIYPFNQIAYKVNPFAEVFARLGFANSASLINLVTLIATLSALNSIMYVASRFVYKLSLNGQAPSALGQNDKRGVPVTAVLATTLFAMIAIIANYVVKEHLLEYLFAIITIALLINWIIIIFSHLVFRKKVYNSAKHLTYKSPFFPYLNFVLIVTLFYILFEVAINLKIKFGLYIPLAWVGCLYIFYKFWNHQQEC